MGFLTFDCVACKKTRYVSKKIRCTPPPGEQCRLCVQILWLAIDALRGGRNNIASMWRRGEVLRRRK